MNKILISVDPGKHTTKSVCKIKNGEIIRTSFRNKILSLNNTLDIEPQGNSFKISFDEKSYIIGDQGEESSFVLSKADICHKLAVYSAISQLRESNTAIQLVLGCPVSIYKNKELREAYKNYILDSKLINIEVNGSKHAFMLENALILPEGSGIVYTHPSLFKGNRSAVIDLGGLNMNFTIYDNLVPEISSMFTLNHGSNELETNILNELSSKFGIALDSKDVPYIIKNGGLKIKGQIDVTSKGAVENIIQNYITGITQAIKKNNYNPDTMNLVFVGGTSLLIRKYLLEYFSHGFVADNAQWSNAEGFLKIGEIKYGKSEKIVN